MTADFEYKLKAVKHELLIEELQAAGVRSLAGVHVAPSGGILHRQKQVPASEMVPNPEWAGWVENPDKDDKADHFILDPNGWLPNPEWTPQKDGLVPRRIPNHEVQKRWAEKPSHVLKRHDPKDYYEEAVYADAGMTVTVHLTEPPDSDMLTLIQNVLDRHYPSGPTAAEKAAQAKAQAKIDAMAAIQKTHPELAEALKALLDG